MNFSLGKKITILFLFALSLLGCSLEGEQSFTYEAGNCTVSEEGRAYFKETAEWLAIYHIFNDSSRYSVYRNQLYFPQGLIVDIETRLSKIFDEDTLAERDTVIELYNLASNLIKEYKTILLRVDPKEPWVDNLLNGNIPTGNAIFDDFYLTFEYEVGILFFSRTGIVLKSNKEELFNVYEVIRQMEEGLISKGLIRANDNISPSTEIRISLEVGEEEAYYFTFNYGWGDCPRGCINNRYWSFKVDRNCVVEFLGAYGDKVPG